MKARELKEKYLNFFKERGHAILPSAPLVPENDPTVLFTTAGMHPLVPYLLGEPHPQGKRLASLQKSFRTVDIDEVGDTSHHTFFEMLGNWSLGDYWKKQAIEWSYEFLVNVLALDPKRLWVTCFAGDDDAPRDTESVKIWKSVGIPDEKIFFYGKKDNWWGPAGETGPCGPDTEMFYDIAGKPHGPNCKPGDNCGRFFEIWNDVFMEYNKTKEGNFEPLKQKNVDTGMGVERTVAVLSGLDDGYKVEDLWGEILSKIEASTKTPYEANEEAHRIIADHVRAATFIIAEGVIPSNKDRGYVLRRLIRRAVRFGRELGVKRPFLSKISDTVVETYKEDYPELEQARDKLRNVLVEEESKFRSLYEPSSRNFRKFTEKYDLKDDEDVEKLMSYTLAPFKIEPEGFVKRLKEEKGFNSLPSVAAGTATFYGTATYGLPLEDELSIVQENWPSADNPEDLKAANALATQYHQELSRTASAGMFKGGLADHSEEVKKLHTATHLLHAALRKVLGERVEQKGSSITADRLRFDFSHPEKLRNEEIKKVEDLINEQIKKDLPVSFETKTLKKALEEGALAFFGERYGDKVKVYTIGDPLGTSGPPFSREVCGGPHVVSTAKVGRVRIKKQEKIGAGLLRLYAVIDQTPSTKS